MTSKPTARENFKILVGMPPMLSPRERFLIALVEAAVKRAIDDEFNARGKVDSKFIEDMFWQELEQRMAEGEVKQ